MLVETFLLLAVANCYKGCHAGVIGSMILGKDSKLKGKLVIYFLLAHGLCIFCLLITILLFLAGTSSSQI
jgi:F0F1-type ATP synthase membrane subunit c/vacuolar-type H+-ATPase subunit K